jgi:hypothetical protein
MTGRPILTRLIWATLFFVFSLPVAIVGNFLIFPFWSWFEETTGIESLGHSGPAEWTYFLVYGALIAVGIGGMLIRRMRIRQ